MEKEDARRRNEEAEGQIERAEEEKERAIVEFEKVMMGLEGGAKKPAPALASSEGELSQKGERVVKRKFELDEDEMLENAKAERAKARKVLDEEKVSLLSSIYIQSSFFNGISWLIGLMILLSPPSPPFPHSGSLL